MGATFVAAVFFAGGLLVHGAAVPEVADGQVGALEAVKAAKPRSPKKKDHKVTICHATSSATNPYTVNTVDKSSVDEKNNRYLNGHGDHTRDIIPPFDQFKGRNWDAKGQAIHKNGCKVPSPSSPKPAPY